MKKRLQIFITGNVQRVGFRMQSAEKAAKYKVCGKALYIDNGILIEAEGEAQPLEQFVNWCRKGPENCTINTFNVHEMQPIHYTSFDIIHGVLSSESMIDKFPIYSAVNQVHTAVRL